MIAVFCERPELENDLGDMLRLFAGQTDIRWNPAKSSPAGRDGGLTVSCALEEQAGAWQVDIRLQGRRGGLGHAAETAAVPAPDDREDALERRAAWPIDPAWGEVERLRQRRRAAKLCLYGALKDWTGYTPPWGSLTGIRPTRLLRQLEAETRDAAAADRTLRQVFDVSCDKAALLRETLQAQAGLYETGNERDIDVYVGIPFCRTRCLYCSFISADLSRGKHDLEGYTQALLREIDQAGDMLPALGKRVRAVYVGGGTPTALGRERLERILARLRERVGAGREWTVEAGRPDTLDADMFRMLHDLGVGRISINPQTMNAETLARIGRSHTPEAVLRALEQARAYPWDINMDVIVGLPGEGLPEVQRTLGVLGGLDIDNLTVHTLAVKRSSRLHERLQDYPLPPDAVVEDMVHAARLCAQDMGMQPYYLYRQKFMRGNLENVGYTRPGKACLYNIDIMEETHPILALGAGGSSKRMFYAEGRHERFFNPKGVDHYLSHVDDMMGRRAAFFGLS